MRYRTDNDASLIPALAAITVVEVIRIVVVAVPTATVATVVTVLPVAKTYWSDRATSYEGGKRRRYFISFFLRCCGFS